MSSSPTVRFSGVYNADTGIVGEAAYLLGKLTGRSSCALCDITHGMNVRGKAAWRRCGGSLPVPLDTFHRNDQPPDVARVTAGLLPCVVAHHDDGVVCIAVTAEDLHACDHRVEALEALLLRYLDRTDRH